MPILPKSKQNPAFDTQESEGTIVLRTTKMKNAYNLNTQIRISQFALSRKTKNATCNLQNPQHSALISVYCNIIKYAPGGVRESKQTNQHLIFETNWWKHRLSRARRAQKKLVNQNVRSKYSKVKLPPTGPSTKLILWKQLLY